MLICFEAVRVQFGEYICDKYLRIGKWNDEPGDDKVEQSNRIRSQDFSTRWRRIS